MSVSVTLHSPEVITIKLGRETVKGLRELSMKESVRRVQQITSADLIKEALKNTFPRFFTE